jgi:hypothetical protein
MYSADQADPGLDLNALLARLGVDPENVVVAGHTPAEPRLAKALPWLAMERRDLFEAYQSIQANIPALTLRRAQHLVSCIKLAKERAAFVGLYRVRGWEPLTPEAYHALPGLPELRAHGFSNDESEAGNLTLFDLELTPVWADWVGRLTFAWPQGRAPIRRAATTAFPVVAISEENRFAPAMPAWPELTLSWPELQTLPGPWRTALSHWRGVYYIFDTGRRAGYVGSASGAENLLGRWRGYADTGHGGNMGLRESRPEDLRFSILQLTSPDLPRDDVVALEQGWKNRLHTREYGLNRN